MSISILLAINIVALCGVMCVAQKIFSSPIRLIFLLCIWLIGFNLPIYGYSICEYIYAFFDVPSAMLVCISLCYLIYFLCVNLGISKSFLSLSVFPSSLQYIWVIFGLIVYLGFLGYGFDIYHLEFKILLLFIATLCVICYSLCPMSGILSISCIVAYQLQILGHMNIINYFIDPFLWFGCMVAVLIHIFRYALGYILERKE